MQRRILRLLDDPSDSGMSLIFVSHDLEVVRSISDHIAIMYAGATVETGPAAGVFGHPSHPYTRALLAAQAGGPRAISRLPRSREPILRWVKAGRLLVRSPVLYGG